MNLIKLHHAIVTTIHTNVDEVFTLFSDLEVC